MRMSGALIFMLPNYVIEAFNLLTDKICLEYGDEVYQMMECFEDNHIGRSKKSLTQGTGIFHQKRQYASQKTLGDAKEKR